MARPRIDLDGVPLCDPERPLQAVVIFRYRTTEGLVVLIPESADVLIPWLSVVAVALDLKTGQLDVELSPDYVAANNWLRGASRLRGRWTDRMLMTAIDASSADPRPVR